MKIGSLAQYAIRCSKEYKDQADQRLLEELNSKLAAITRDTLQQEIDRQSHLINVQDGKEKIITCLHLDNESLTSTEGLDPLLEKSAEFKRLKELAENEGFVSLSAILRKSVAGRSGFNLLLEFQLPEQ